MLNNYYLKYFEKFFANEDFLFISLNIYLSIVVNNNC